MLSKYWVFLHGFAGSVTGSRQTRLQQLVNWCGGKDFDGCLIFDECHKAKNFVPVSRNIVQILLNREKTEVD